jgi:alpha-tubulin N-acetyltransferase 1
VITSYVKLKGLDQRIYLKISMGQCQGFLKVGVKRLFTRTRGGELIEMTPLSVLDFYVHSSVQRGGIGKQLFEAMLGYEDATPSKLAYDRPSHKLKGFLFKHYNLRNYVKQTHNFIVFDEYFQGSTRPSRR